MLSEWIKFRSDGRGAPIEAAPDREWNDALALGIHARFARVSLGADMHILALRALAVLGLFQLAASLPAIGQPVLSGTITSAEEGAMEGVLVSAKRVGSTITVTVASDAEGRYAFPAAKLEPGP